MKVLRDFSRPKEDDWKLNVQRYMDETSESLEIIHPETKECLGWIIRNRFE